MLPYATQARSTTQASVTTTESEQLYEIVQWHNKTFKLPKCLPAGVQD
jgi:hypothetical protein